MSHARILNVHRDRVLVTCACERWSVTVPARSGVLKAAAEAHDEHLATISPDALPPEQQGEQGRGVASVASLPDHPKSTAHAMQGAGGGEGHRLPRQGEQ